MISTADVIPPARSRSGPLRAAVLCVAAGALAATVPFVSYVLVWILAAAQLACVLVPVWYTWHQGRFDAFEPIHLVGALSFMYYGVGAIWTVKDPGMVAYDIHLVKHIPQAALYCLLGYLALLAGYYLPWRGRGGAARTGYRVVGPLFLVVPGIAGFMGYLSESVGGRLRSLTQLEPLFLFAWFVGWLLYFGGRASRSQRGVLFFGLIPAALLVAYLNTHTKSLTAILFGLPLIAMWYGRRKIPWKLIVAGVLALIFVVFPFYNTFRQLDEEASRTQRMGATYSKISGWSTSRYLDASIGTFKRRFAMINSVAVVVRDVPRWVPHAWGGTIFMPAMVLSVPRLIWPDKPELTYGQDFGYRFRVTNIYTRETSIAVMVPGELYWNFGLLGIIAGMGLWGAGMRGAYRRYGPEGGVDPVRLGMYVVLLTRFALLGGGLASELVFLVRILVLLEILRWVGLYFGMIRPRIPGTADASGSAAAART